jgi:hypothetical protein
VNLREEGRLDFGILTEEEQLNYIKYSINQPEIVMKAAETLLHMEEVHPRVYS